VLKNMSVPPQDSWLCAPGALHPWDEEKLRWITGEISLRDCHAEDLPQIPPQVGNDTVGKTNSGVFFEHRLELVPAETAERSLGVNRYKMHPQTIFIGLC
jgi:hypothetical protein